MIPNAKKELSEKYQIGSVWRCTYTGFEYQFEFTLSAVYQQLEFDKNSSYCHTTLFFTQEKFFHSKEHAFFATEVVEPYWIKLR